MVRPWSEDKIVSLYTSKLRPSIAVDVEKCHPKGIVEAMKIALRHKDANVSDCECQPKKRKGKTKTKRSIDNDKNMSEEMIDLNVFLSIYRANCVIRLPIEDSIKFSEKSDNVESTRSNLATDIDLANDVCSLDSDVSSGSEIVDLGGNLSYTNSK
jgi:hypothetical protein